ncbi:hypothetical protein C8R45DRAFT_1031680 [Mycena sanguinolenta]|nr:hypothetical protein C8R45DRAFT_1031680 [Mycena sanguinolenta]
MDGNVLRHAFSASVARGRATTARAPLSLLAVLDAGGRLRFGCDDSTVYGASPPSPPSPSMCTSTFDLHIHLTCLPSHPTRLFVPSVTIPTRLPVAAAPQSHCTPPTKPPHSANATPPRVPSPSVRTISPVARARGATPVLVGEYYYCDVDDE